MTTMNKFDEQYENLAKTTMKHGEWIENERTGKRCLTHFGHMSTYNLEGDDIPLLTTKRVFYKQMIAELLAFIRGCTNAKDFRDLGCNFWDKNANETKDWLNNPHRKGTDDLGKIYGYQARNFNGVDQLKSVIKRLDNKKDDRRLIVTHYNPSELDEMALPPCHLLYNFGISNDTLNLCMYQRSADIPLGVPMNIASYALLLKLIAQITGYKVGKFVHMIWNAHIYEDQYDTLKRQMTHASDELIPKIKINPKIKSLKDLETWVTVDDFEVYDYDTDVVMFYPFSE